MKTVMFVLKVLAEKQVVKDNVKADIKFYSN